MRLQCVCVCVCVVLTKGLFQPLGSPSPASGPRVLGGLEGRVPTLGSSPQVTQPCVWIQRIIKCLSGITATTTITQFLPCAKSYAH